MNIDYNSEESYDVDFSRRHTTIERIMSLKTIDFQNKKPGRFKIGIDIDWNHALLEAFLDVLNHLKERGIQWEEFKLSIKARDQPFTSVLLQRVNGLNIFKKMDVDLWFGERDEYSADCEYLFPGINQNRQLESLYIGITGHVERFEYDFTAFASHLQEMTTLKDLKLESMCYFNAQSFRESLSENKSLESLQLAFLYCNDIADEGLSNIIASLASHPKLEELRIDISSDQFGESSSTALQTLLSMTQTLSKLEFFNMDTEGGLNADTEGGLNADTEGGLNAECIVKGLKKNQSLKSLTTVNSLYGDLMLSRFFQILPHCPNLEHLGLWEKSVTKNDLEQVIHMDRLQKPIKLQMHGGVIRDNVAVMTKLLRCHPEVRLNVHDPDQYGNVEFEHICELNWNGRYLIDRSTTSVPLSLWPIVFEQVKNKPSFLYEFLKGPCFAARNDSVV